MDEKDIAKMAEDVDFEQMFAALMSFGRIIAGYYRLLLGEGLSEDVALTLTSDYQDSLVRTFFAK